MQNRFIDFIVVDINIFLNRGGLKLTKEKRERERDHSHLKHTTN